MILAKHIEKKIQEFEWNLWAVTEWGMEREEELLEKIAELEKEIAEHECS